jgi:hypothetical protein
MHRNRDRPTPLDAMVESVIGRDARIEVADCTETETLLFGNGRFVRLVDEYDDDEVISIGVYDDDSGRRVGVVTVLATGAVEVSYG